ncbi:MAG: hypothetical protein LBJ17_02385 [Dysgonamonadaceae bacterium]|jgi:hypothetical protein|nr:hypothetical protein [Dysgonamonadaceae bacterium]
MYKSLIYKEWIKTRSTITLLAAVFLAAGIYSFMKTGEEIRLTGMISFWDTLIQKGINFFTYYKYMPLSLGILTAITQYIPEIQQKRLKLTLHLPMPETRIIITMLLYGLAVTIIFSVITIAVLLSGLSVSFPREIIRLTFWFILPWFLASPAGYLLAAWIIIEPKPHIRILCAVPSAAAMSFFFFNAKAGAMQPFIIYLAIFTIILILFPLYSITRFKEGK